MNGRWSRFTPSGTLNPFRAPEPLPILNPSNFVPKNGFPVVKGLRVLKSKYFGSMYCDYLHYLVFLYLAYRLYCQTFLGSILWILSDFAVVLRPPLLLTLPVLGVFMSVLAILRVLPVPGISA